MKRGFTLIELLAVIVILAVIALIAIPIVMDIIEDSRKSAAISSAEGYVRAVNYKIAQEALKKVVVEDGEYIIGENELAVEARNVEKITGEYIIEGSKVSWAGLCINHYSVSYSNGVSAIDKTGNYCNEEEPYVFIEPEAELLSNACSTESKYTNETKFKIKTVEDLVCLSNLVNSGKNFADKEIYLLSDIDFNNDSSYKDKNTTIYGDINGDSNTEGLKIELTTGRGFKPIGNNTNKFSGTFLGYAFTISNLMINRETVYLGLFGYNTGTISGIKLRNVSVTSTSTDVLSYTGGAVGYNELIIKNIDLQGNITGSKGYVGGIVGSNNNVTITDSMFKGNVTGNMYVGGIAGGASGGNTRTVGLVYDSKITSIANSGTISIGKAVGYSYGATQNVRVSNVTLDYTRSRQYYNDGAELNNLFLTGIDDVIDTYIGGDNDSDHYYFDYDNEGNITLFSTDRTPIQNKLKGTGTDVDPYLIKNDKDWKMASALVTQSKYFTVTKDIDFNNKKYYALGTNNNRFNGYINGNMHTVSNVSLEGYNYMSLFGYNLGEIEGFEFDNIEILSGSPYIGTVVGYNAGTINGIRLRNVSVTSTSTDVLSYTGGAVGYNALTIKNIDAQGDVTGSKGYVGGIVGSNSNVTITDSMFKGNVTGNMYVGGIAGGASGGNTRTVGLVYDSKITSIANSGTISIGKAVGSSYGTTQNVRVSNVTLDYTRSRQYYNDGVELSALTLEEVDGTLDTPVNGDDGDGYYFDYDSNNVITLYSVAEKPVRKLSGSGTESDPYQISSVDDWNLLALSTYSSSTYYVITNDIDFTGKTIYPMGTSSRKFNGHINGNMHTLSNMSINGLGIFEYNQGSIEGIKFNNITITSTERGTGLIGTNEGTVKGIEVKNLTINATISSGDTSHTGGLVGINKGIIKTVVVEGNITSNKWRVGGIVGYNNAEIDGAVFKGSISTSEAVGGLVGKSDEVVSGKSLRIKGLVYNTTITASVSNTNMGKTIGSAVSTTNTTKNMNITLVGTRQTGYYVDGTEINELTTSNISDVVDTTDGDSDGYYFIISNGNLELVKD